MLFHSFILMMLSPCLKNSFVVSLPTVAEYFPQLEDDMSKVVWAHGVNNKCLLEKAVDDERVMMVEADVVLGTINGHNDIVPIMAHPPAITSDLTLAGFMETLIASNKSKKKGVKLDFKTVESFQSSWSIIEALKEKINFPFFLNADIIDGPVMSTAKPVDPGVFLRESARKFPESVLSVGWTTSYGPGIEGNYTKNQLQEMESLIKENKITQPVTLCLRAGLAAQTTGIKDLIETIDRYQERNTTSATIWMSTNSDPVDVTKLKNIIMGLGKKKVFLDVPKFLLDQLA